MPAGLLRHAWTPIRPECSPSLLTTGTSHEPENFWRRGNHSLGLYLYRLDDLAAAQPLAGRRRAGPGRRLCAAAVRPPFATPRLVEQAHRAGHAERRPVLRAALHLGHAFARWRGGHLSGPGTALRHSAGLGHSGNAAQLVEDRQRADWRGG